jgi:hypothetical protein
MLLKVGAVFLAIARHVAADQRQALGADDVVGRGRPTAGDLGHVGATGEAQ